MLRHYSDVLSPANQQMRQRADVELGVRQRRDDASRSLIARLYRIC